MRFIWGILTAILLVGCTAAPTKVPAQPAATMQPTATVASTNVDTPTLTPEVTCMVQAEKVFVRELPTRNSRVITVVTVNTKLLVVGEEKGWLKLAKGYIFSKYCK